VLEVLLSGLVTGWAIAIPIGAVGALLVALTARTSIRTGSAAAMGVATVDGGYAAVAVVGGAAIADRLEPYDGWLRVLSAVVLLGIAALTIWLGRRSTGRSAAAPASSRDLLPWQAFAAFLALTAVNPTTVIYFVAVIVGNPHLADGWAEGVVFVLAAFVASASWQLTLAGIGAALGRSVTGHRGRVVTAWVSGLIIAGLAVRTLLG
jgi:threonine/homoserine/homoserine lactone efflux protein